MIAINNDSQRLQPVFFYGLYMSPDVLISKGVEPRQPRKAVLKNYRLHIGKLATLLRDPQAETWGMVYDLKHDEIHRLYWGAGLDAYVAEAVMVSTEQHLLAALCCNLLHPPAEDEKNPDYRQKLYACMTKLKLPLPS